MTDDERATKLLDRETGSWGRPAFDRVVDAFAEVRADARRTALIDAAAEVYATCAGRLGRKTQDEIAERIYALGAAPPSETTEETR